LAALDDQQVLLGSDVEVLGTETRYRDGDAVAVFAATLDIERREIVAAAAAALIFQQVEEPVKPDGRTAIGGKVKTRHRNKSSIEQFETKSPLNAALSATAPSRHAVTD